MQPSGKKIYKHNTTADSGTAALDQMRARTDRDEIVFLDLPPAHSVDQPPVVASIVPPADTPQTEKAVETSWATFFDEAPAPAPQPSAMDMFRPEARPESGQPTRAGKQVFAIDTTLLDAGSGYIEGKTRTVPAWMRVLSATCVTLLLLLVLAPAGYILYTNYARTQKTYIELTPDQQAACDAVLTAAAPDLSISLSGAVQPARLQADMEQIVNGIGNRFVDTKGDTRVRDYLIDALAAMGYQTETDTMQIQPFTIDVEATREKKIKKPKPNNGNTNGESAEREHPDDVAGPDDVEGAEEFDEDGNPIEYEIVIETFHVYYNTASVIAIKRTSVPNPKIIVLSAHMDTVYQTRGAIDNGSGVATLLEVVRVLTESGRDFGVEIRFCFFGGEELGMHGAYNYLDLLNESERARHIALINVDMAACTQNGIPKAFSVSTYGRNTPNGYETGSFSTPANNTVSAAAIAAFGRDGFGMPRLYAPIHWEKNDLRPFHRAGIDAGTISWREIDPSRAITNFHIASPLVMHTTDDVLSTMDMQSLEQTTRFTIATFEAYLHELNGGTWHILAQEA